MLEDQSHLVQDEWIYRVYPPTNPTPSSRLLLLLHGWTGDENSMSVFARNLYGKDWILLPRGPIFSPEGGFGWVLQNNGLTFHLDDFLPIVDRLVLFLDRWIIHNHLSTDHFSMIGFSQGTMMAYAMTLQYSNRIDALAALAGFFPSNWQGKQAETAFYNKPLFVAHGKKDEIIPISLDDQSVQYFREIGAQVTFYEDTVAHKISLQTSYALKRFFSVSSSSN